MALTLYINEYKIFSMKILRNTIVDRDGLGFIYSGLACISSEGRRFLKKTAQTLIEIQNRSGAPVPGSICREIIKNKAGEL